MKNKRKRPSIKEIRLLERMRGFCQCHEQFTELWRKNVNISTKDHDPLVRMWTTIEKTDKQISSMDLEYKKIMWPRIYGEEFGK